jgi:hypothetical protein
VAALCLDPLDWTCAAEFGATVDGHGCSGGTCSQVAGGDWICGNTSPTEQGSSFGGSFTSGVEPDGESDGKEVTDSVFKICIWENFCWEECAPVQGLPSPECSSDYLPPIPWGGFDVPFGADCPAGGGIGS